MLAIEIYRFDVIQETSDMLTNIHTEGRRRFSRVSRYSAISSKELYIDGHGHEASMPAIPGLTSSRCAMCKLPWLNMMTRP